MGEAKTRAPGDGKRPDHPVPYAVYVKVWLLLLVLTATTVGVRFLDMHKFAVFAAMMIAAVKSTLVVLYFMHLRYEKKATIPIMMAAVLVIYGVFVSLTFTDYLSR